jgi:hypothetical protein
MDFVTPTLILSVAVNLIIVGIAYGTIKTKLDEVMNHRGTCNDRFKAIEINHNSAINEMSNEMKAMSGSLNQLIGKIDMFFAQQHLETPKKKTTR